jgi:hypothetical protein
MTGTKASWLIGTCALVVYIGLASGDVVDGDSAELATLGALGGRAHPSGYPLYVLWLRAWSWLPGATPAHTAATWRSPARRRSSCATTARPRCSR